MKLTNLIYNIVVRKIQTDKIISEYKENYYIIKMKKNEIQLTLAARKDICTDVYLGSKFIKNKKLRRKLIKYSKKILKKTLKEDIKIETEAEEVGTNKFLEDKMLNCKCCSNNEAGNKTEIDIDISLENYYFLNEEARKKKMLLDDFVENLLRGFLRSIEENESSI